MRPSGLVRLTKNLVFCLEIVVYAKNEILNLERSERLTLAQDDDNLPGFFTLSEKRQWNYPSQCLIQKLRRPTGASLQLYSFTMELFRCCRFCCDEIYAYYSTLFKSSTLPDARYDSQIPILGTSGDVKSKKPEWRIKYAWMIGVHIPENGNQDGNHYQTTKSCRDPR